MITEKLRKSPALRRVWLCEILKLQHTDILDMCPIQWQQFVKCLCAQSKISKEMFSQVGVEELEKVMSLHRALTSNPKHMGWTGTPTVGMADPVNALMAK